MFIDFILFMAMALFAIPAICGYYAHSRGRSFWLWFLIGTLLPVISYFILILLPDKISPVERSLEDLRVQLKMLGTKPEVPLSDPLRSRITQTKASTIAFEPILDSQPKALRILIDGVPLQQVLHLAELPYAQEEGNDAWAGAYQGVPLSLALYPYKHFLGEPSRKFSIENRPIILLGGEEIPEGLRKSWQWTVQISFYRKLIVWHHARQEARMGKWLYYKPELWVFNRLQYEDALLQLTKFVS